MTTRQIAKTKGSQQYMTISFSKERAATLHDLTRLFSFRTVESLLEYRLDTNIDDLFNLNLSTHMDALAQHTERIWHGEAQGPLWGPAEKPAVSYRVPVKLSARQRLILSWIAEGMGYDLDSFASKVVASGIAPSLGNYIAENEKNARLSKLYQIWGGDEKCYLEKGE